VCGSPACAGVSCPCSHPLLARGGGFRLDRSDLRLTVQPPAGEADRQGRSRDSPARSRRQLPGSGPSVSLRSLRRRAGCCPRCTAWRRTAPPRSQPQRARPIFRVLQAGVRQMGLELESLQRLPSIAAASGRTFSHAAVERELLRLVNRPPCRSAELAQRSEVAQHARSTACPAPKPRDAHSSPPTAHARPINSRAGSVVAAARMFGVAA